MNTNDLMTRRDFFAATCPESELKARTPATVGEMRDELIRREIIPSDRKQGDVMRSYRERDSQKLKCILRFEYADEMIAASEK